MTHRKAPSLNLQDTRTESRSIVQTRPNVHRLRIRGAVILRTALSALLGSALKPYLVLKWVLGILHSQPAFLGRRWCTLDWKQHGVKIVRAGELDTNTPQSPGMTRAAAITNARTGASKLWAGTVVVQPHARTAPHHHGELETVIYVVRGRARMRWGDRLEFCDEADPGDFIYVPPFVPHQEINARPDIPCEAVIVRSGQDPVVVNLDIDSPEPVNESEGEKPFHPGKAVRDRAR